MIKVQTVQIVIQGNKILGAVIDAPELDKLTLEESAMPVGANMRECTAAVDTTTGDVYVMGEPLVKGPLRPFGVDAYHARAKERDTSIANMDPSLRADLFGADWEPEAVKIAKRTAEHKAAREEGDRRRKAATSKP